MNVLNKIKSKPKNIESTNKNVKNDDSSEFAPTTKSIRVAQNENKIENKIITENNERTETN